MPSEIWKVARPKTKQKDRRAKTQRSFCGAPDWIRTSGLPGRSRTLYPTELRTHIYENRPKTGFSYSVISGQIVVRLLQNRRTRCRKMALLCGFSAELNCLSELSENPDTQWNKAVSSRFSSVVHKVENHIKRPRSFFRTGFAGFCSSGGQRVVTGVNLAGKMTFRGRGSGRFHCKFLG